MKRLLYALTALLLWLPCGMAATVTGTLTGFGSSEKQVVFTPLDWPMISTDGSTITGPRPTTVTTVNQTYTATLGPGTYRMSVDGAVITVFRVLSTDTTIYLGKQYGLAFLVSTNDLWHIKTDSEDTNALYLTDKLFAGTGISLSITNSASTNRAIVISGDGNTVNGLTNLLSGSSRLTISGTGQERTIDVAPENIDIGLTTGGLDVSRLQGGIIDSSHLPPASTNYDFGYFGVLEVTNLVPLAATPSRPAKIDANTNLTSGLINLASADDVTGVLPSANGGAGTVSGLVKANGSGTTSAAVAGDDYQAPNNWTASGATNSTLPGVARANSGVFTNGVQSTAYDYSAPATLSPADAGVSIDFAGSNRSATMTLTGAVTFAFSNLSGTAIKTYSIWMQNAQATNCAFTFPAGTTQLGILGYQTASKKGKMIFEYVPGVQTNVSYIEQN